jgi:hypothetical protein
MHRYNYLLGFIVSIIVAPLSSAASAALFAESAKWTINPVPVCWENPSAVSVADQNLIREAVRDSWEANSSLQFNGWDKCTDDSRGIRIKISDEGPHAKEVGNRLDGKRDGIVLNTTFANWSPSCAANFTVRGACIRGLTVHNFGHAIGFTHEHNRPDTPGECNFPAQGTTGDSPLTPYDLHSVMNYCNPRYNNDGKLSDFDKFAVQRVYGGRLFNLQPRILRSIVYLEAQKAAGSREIRTATGIIISVDGNVLTTSDLLASFGEETNISVRAYISSRGAVSRPADVVRKEKGLLLLKLPPLDGLDYPKFCTSNDDGPNLQDKYYMAGFPDGAPLSSRSFKPNWDGSTNTWAVATPISLGEQGSAVFTDKGELVGVIRAAETASRGNITTIKDLKSFASDLAPCEAVAPSKRPVISDNVAACKNAAEENLTRTEIFTKSVYVRAPGPGIRTEMIKVQEKICFNAPPNSRIFGQVMVKDLGNSDGRGRISAVEYLSVETEPTGACVIVEAWTDVGPNTAEGWQKGELQGQLQYFPSIGDRKRIAERCAEERRTELMR